MSLLSTLGGLIGLSVAGPAGAAIGAGIGTLAGGGDVKDAVKAGILGYGIGSIPAVQGMVGQGAALLGLGGGGGAAAGAVPAVAGPAARTAAAAAPTVAGGATTTGFGAAAGRGISSLINLVDNPLVMASLLQASEPKNVMAASPLQQRQMETGERLPDFQGAPIGALYVDSETGTYYDTKAERDAAVAARRAIQGYAKGGEIRGPGTGRSDSIPARIYQDGKPVQEARLSDGEFVMTNKAVRGAGDGNTRDGVERMYEMMRQFERRAG